MTLSLFGAAPTGRVLFQLPKFVRNIASASSGSVDQATRTVTLQPNVRRDGHLAPEPLNVEMPVPGTRTAVLGDVLRA